MKLVGRTGDIRWDGHVELEGFRSVTRENAQMILLFSTLLKNSFDYMANMK